MSDVTVSDDFRSRTTAFMAWMQQRPGANVSPKIQVSDLRYCNAGRGIVAAADIKKDEELFSIRLADVLTVQTSSLRSAKPSILERLDAWNALVLAMIYEESQGKESKWWSYMQILPNEFDTLVYWSPSELAELDGSAVLDKIGKDGADTSFTKILLPIVQQHSDLFGRYSTNFRGPDARTTLLELAHRMATLIMAYGFDLEAETSSSDEEDDEDGSSQTAYELNKGMVPLADLFNADGHHNNAHLLQDQISMTMIALGDISCGQQIFNDFGQVPRSDLLRRYGYVTDNYRKWDVVEISIETIIQAANEYNKINDRSALVYTDVDYVIAQEKEHRLELAASWDVLQDGYDLSRPPENETFEFDQAMVLTINALLLDSEEFDQAPEEPPERSSQSIVKDLDLVLQQIIASRQTAYKTTMTEDQAILKDRVIQGRHRMAVDVRLGEKEILALAADEINIRMAEHNRKADREEDPDNVKRRKYD